MSLIYVLLAKSSVILLLALIARGAISRLAPALRRLVLLVGLVGAVALPLASLAVPIFRVYVADPFATTTGSSASYPSFQGPVRPLMRPRFASVGQNQPVALTGPESANQRLPGRPTAFAVSRNAGDSGFGATTILEAIWLLGFCGLVIYRIVGWALAERLAGRSSQFEGDVSDLGIPLGTKVLVNSTSQPAAPITWGVLHPKILLPEGANEWSDAAVRTVIQHEVAHILKKDNVWQGFANFACSVYWFNPLFWIGSSVLRADAEEVADDFVIVSGCDPADYAAQLVELAASTSRHGYPAMGFATPTKLEKRVKSILDSTRSRSTSIGASGGALLAGVFVIAFGIGPIAFGKAPSKVKHRRSTHPVASAENLRSNIWRIDLSEDDDEKSLVYVYQDGTFLWRGDVKSKSGSMSYGTSTSTTKQLDARTSTYPAVKLSNGSMMNACRVVLPSYRKLLAQSGIEVTPSTIAMLKSDIPVQVPPDRDHERAEYLRGRSDVSELKGASVWLRGDILGIIDRGAMDEVKTKSLHWPQLLKSSASPAPTGYWKVGVPSTGAIWENFYHRDQDGLHATLIDASPQRGGTGRESSRIFGNSISDWGIEIRQYNGSIPYPERFNNLLIEGDKLDNPQYRTQEEALGFVITPISKGEFDSATDPKLTPELARSLFAAENDQETNVARMQHTMMIQYSSGQNVKPWKDSRTIDVKTNRIYPAPPKTPSDQSPFDEARAQKTIDGQNLKLTALAQDYANAKVAASEAQNSAVGAGQAAERLADILLKIHKLEQNYGLVGSRSTVNPSGSDKFFHVVEEIARKKAVQLHSNALATSALYGKGQISEFEVERAKELESIENEKVRWLNQRAEKSTPLGTGSRP